MHPISGNPSMCDEEQIEVAYVAELLHTKIKFRTVSTAQTQWVSY